MVYFIVENHLNTGNDKAVQYGLKEGNQVKVKFEFRAQNSLLK